MKLYELLIEQRDGEETLQAIKEKNEYNSVTDTINKNIDEDYGIVLTSKFLNESLEKFGMINAEVSSAFKNISEEFNLLEERKMSRGKIQTVFGRMCLDNIKENFEIIQEELQNLKLLKQYDKKDLHKALAFIKLSANMIAEESNNNTFFLENFENSVLNEAVSKEVDNLLSVLNN